MMRVDNAEPTELVLKYCKENDMNIKKAMELAKQEYPNMIITGAGDSDGAWLFGFDFPGMDSYPSEPGLPILAVTKDDGTVLRADPGTEAFDRYMPSSKPIGIPS